MIESSEGLVIKKRKHYIWSSGARNLVRRAKWVRRRKLLMSKPVQIGDGAPFIVLTWLFSSEVILWFY